ncbi:MAG: DNA gyrase inhibitor YacG [Caldimonas sp.]
MPDRHAANEPRRVVRCPGCGGESVYAVNNRFRPFCSERCRLGDLGAWASESYRVGGLPSTSDDEDEDDEGGAMPTAS